MNAALCDEGTEGSGILSRVLWAETEKACFGEDDVERLLGPLRKRIMAGEFDKSLRRGLPFWRFVSVAAAVVVAASLTQARTGDGLVRIPDNQVPRSGAVRAGRRASGRVVLEGAGAEGIRLTLVDIQSGASVREAVTDEQGVFRFTDIPQGSYRIRADLPPGLRLADEADGGEWVTLDGSTDINIGDNNDKEGLTIELCHS